MKRKNAVILAGATAGIILGMKYVFPVLLPFFAGWILAESVYPGAAGISRSRIGRKIKITSGMAGAVLILIFTVLTIWGCLLGLQVLAEKIGDCIQYYPVIKREAALIIGKCCQGVEEITGISAGESTAYVYRQISSAGKYFLEDGNGMEQAVASAKWCIAAVGGGIITVVSGILFLQERESIRQWGQDRILFRKIGRITKELGKNGKAYLKAQMKIIGLVCLICVAGLWILKVPGAIGYGILIGVFDALPILGTGTFLIPAGILQLIQGETVSGVGFFVIYLITAGIRQFLEPRLVGKGVGISPLMVLFAVYLGVFLYGGWGFLLGPLTALILYEIYKELENSSQEKTF